MSFSKTGVCGECSWHLSSDGVLTIYPSNGLHGMLDRGCGRWPWDRYAEDVREVIIKDGVIACSDIGYMFGGMRKCSRFNLSPLDTRPAKDMCGIFSGCVFLADISSLSSWNTQSVENMTLMFNDCASLSDINPIAGWDTKNVKKFDCMFFGCTSLSDAEPIRKWAFNSVVSAGTVFGRTSLGGNMPDFISALPHQLGGRLHADRILLRRHIPL